MIYRVILVRLARVVYTVIIYVPAFSKLSKYVTNYQLYCYQAFTLCGSKISPTMINNAKATILLKALSLFHG